MKMKMQNVRISNMQFSYFLNKQKVWGVSVVRHHINIRDIITDHNICMSFNLRYYFLVSDNKQRNYNSMSGPRKIKREEAAAMEDYWYIYIILLLLETENRFSQEVLRAVSTNAAETHSVSSSRSYLKAKIIKSIMMVKILNFLSICNI